MSKQKFRSIEEIQADLEKLRSAYFAAIRPLQEERARYEPKRWMPEGTVIEHEGARFVIDSWLEDRIAHIKEWSTADDL